MKPTTNRNQALAMGCALLLSAGCALLGNEAPFPASVNTSGMGPFRLVTDDETALGDSSPLDVESIQLSVDRGQVSGDTLFYGGAMPLSAPPARDTTLRPREVDWAQYEARSIWRTTGETDLAFAITSGAEVLTASEAWEGGWVGEPFVLVLSDGRARLYYAAEGGIGVAEAPAVGGAFTRVGTAPIIAGSALGSPSVIEMPSGEFFMYFDDGADVWLARSGDGLSFTRDMTPVDLTIEPGNESEEDIEEIAYLGPGAIVATTPVGRQVIRLYAEVWGALPTNGNADDRLVIATASTDGVTFSRTKLPALNPDRIAETDADVFALGRPTARILDTGETLLYLTRNTTYTADNADTVVGQRLVLSVAPAFAELPGFMPPAPPEAPEP